MWRQVLPQASTKEILYVFADESPDHRVNILRIQLCLIALLLKTDFGAVIAVRTPPRHSWKNLTERMMSHHFKEDPLYWISCATVHGACVGLSKRGGGSVLMSFLLDDLQKHMPSYTPKTSDNIVYAMVAMASSHQKDLVQWRVIHNMLTALYESLMHEKVCL